MADAQAPLFPDLDDAAEDEPLELRSAVEFRELLCSSALNRHRGSRLPFEFTLNPYRGCEFGCGYCYARYTHEYLGIDGQEAWERRILVKRNLAAVLRKELRAGRLTGEVAIGTATDPYQPAERRYGITRAALEVLALHRRVRVSITTKSPLVVRDLDLLRVLTERGAVSVNVSLISLDRALLRRLEPRAPTPERRLEAVARLAAGGIRVGIFVMPILPAITDDDDALDALVARAAEAGAHYVVCDPLFLRSAARRSFLPVIGTEFPHLSEQYRAWYGRSAYPPREYRDRVRARVRALARRYGLGGGRARRAEAERPDPQLALGL